MTHWTEHSARDQNDRISLVVTIRQIYLKYGSKKRSKRRRNITKPDAAQQPTLKPKLHNGISRFPNHFACLIIQPRKPSAQHLRHHESNERSNQNHTAQIKASVIATLSYATRAVSAATAGFGAETKQAKAVKKLPALRRLCRMLLRRRMQLKRAAAASRTHGRR